MPCGNPPFIKLTNQRMTRGGIHGPKIASQEQMQVDANQ